MTSRSNKQKYWQKALDLFVATEGRIATGEIVGLKAADLFTTYFPSRNGKENKSVLTEFCRCNEKTLPKYYKEFFLSLLSQLEHPLDFYVDGQETPLMKLVRPPRYENAPKELETAKCESWLLAYGSNPLLINPSPFDHSAFDIALLNNNWRVINLFKSSVKTSGAALPPRTEELLRVYDGEVLEPSDNSTIHLYQLYRVANQAQNFAMVKKLDDENDGFRAIQQEYLDEWFKDDLANSPGKNSYFHPPLWAYNINQLRDYAREVAKKN